MDDKITETPTSTEGQKATNNAIPASTSGHNNPEWTPLKGMCGGGGNTK